MHPGASATFAVNSMAHASSILYANPKRHRHSLSKSIRLVLEEAEEGRRTLKPECYLGWMSTRRGRVGKEAALPAKVQSGFPVGWLPMPTSALSPTDQWLKAKTVCLAS